MPRADPRTSLVVLSRDRRAELLRTVPRHLALPERPRVVVVDDASEDGSAEAVRAAHPEVTVLRQERPVGGAGRNVGARAVASPYVAFSDDDAWWEPGALRAAADLLDDQPRLAVVQARILVGPAEREDPTCTAMAASPLTPAPGQPGHPILSFVACAVVVRREAFLAAGGFPARIGVGGEEELLSWDLAAAGWQLSYVPRVVGHHDPPPAPGGRPERRARDIRNALWTTWLRRPAGAAARRTAHDLARLPLDGVSARGVGRAVAGVPWVLRERRVSPPHVEAQRRALEEHERRRDPG